MDIIALIKYIYIIIAVVYSDLKWFIYPLHDDDDVDGKGKVKQAINFIDKVITITIIIRNRF